MGDPHGLINEMDNEKKSSSSVITFKKRLFISSPFPLNSLVWPKAVRDNIRLGARQMQWRAGDGGFPWLEVWNGPSEAYKLFNFIKSILKLCSVWYLFRINWPKYELNIWAVGFWTHVPPPLKNVCVCGGGEVVPPPLMIWVLSTQALKAFKTLQTIHYLYSNRFDLGLR